MEGLRCADKLKQLAIIWKSPKASYFKLSANHKQVIKAVLSGSTGLACSLGRVCHAMPWLLLQAVAEYCKFIAVSHTLFLMRHAGVVSYKSS